MSPSPLTYPKRRFSACFRHRSVQYAFLRHGLNRLPQFGQVICFGAISQPQVVTRKFGKRRCSIPQFRKNRHHRVARRIPAQHTTKSRGMEIWPVGVTAFADAGPRGGQGAEWETPSEPGRREPLLRCPRNDGQPEPVGVGGSRRARARAASRLLRLARNDAPPMRTESDISATCLFVAD